MSDYTETTKGKITNALVDMSFNISENCINLLVYLLQRGYVASVMNEDSSAPIVIVERTRLVEVAGIAKNGGRLKIYLDELQLSVFKYESTEVILSAPIVAAYEWRSENDMVRVEFSRILWPLLANFISHYTVFNLAELWLIKGAYAKRFYLDVMRWSGNGTMKLQVDNIRARYGMEYQFNDIVRRIVEPGMKQIHELTNIRVHRLEDTKRGKKVETLNFHIAKPGKEVMQPLAQKMVDRFGLTPGFAQLVVDRMSYKDIFTVLETIDGQRLKIKNIGAYTAAIFRNYGIEHKEKKRNTDAA